MREHFVNDNRRRLANAAARCAVVADARVPVGRVVQVEAWIDHLERTAVAVSAPRPCAAVGVVHGEHRVAVRVHQCDSLAAVFQSSLELPGGQSDALRAVTQKERTAVLRHDDPLARRESYVAEAVRDAAVELRIAQLHSAVPCVEQLYVLVIVATNWIVHDFAQAHIALERRHDRGIDQHSVVEADPNRLWLLRRKEQPASNCRCVGGDRLAVQFLPCVADLPLEHQRGALAHDAHSDLLERDVLRLERGGRAAEAHLTNHQLGAIVEPDRVARRARPLAEHRHQAGVIVAELPRHQSQLGLQRPVGLGR